MPKLNICLLHSVCIHWQKHCAMGLKVDRLLGQLLPTSVRLSPEGSEHQYNGAGVYLSPQQHDTLYVLIDTEGYTYHLPFGDPSRTYTFRDLVEHVANLVHRYLAKPGPIQAYSDVVVDLRCDLRTPPNKALTRKTGDRVPDLPENGQKDAMMAWYLKFSRDHSTVANQSEFDAKRALGFELPMTRGQAKKRGLLESTVYIFEHYLHSPGFKRFVNRVIFENILSFIEFPVGSAGHAYVIARSKYVSNMRTPTSYGPIPSHLQFDYQEADCAIGAVSAHCRHPSNPQRWCDLLVHSTSSDGDTFLVLAASRNRCVSPAPCDSAGRRLEESADDLRFANAVTVIRSNIYYNFNEIYIGLMELHRRNASADLVFDNPLLSAFVPMMIGGASFDYTSRGWLPGISDGRLFAAYYENIDYFQNLVSSHVDLPNFVIVNPDALGRLIAAAAKKDCSKAEFRIDEDYTTAAAAFSVHGKPLPSAGRIRVLAAQLSWAFSYFTASSYELVAPDAFQTAPGSGFSLWGYVDKGHKGRDERLEVGAPEDVDTKALFEMHAQRSKASEAERVQRLKASQILAEIQSDHYAL